MSNFRIEGAPIYNFDARVLNRATARTLPCGIPVYHIGGNTMNVVRIDFLFDAGSMYQNDKLVPQHCLSLLREGSENYSASGIADILDYHAVFSELSFNRNKAGMGFYIDIASAAKVLPAITDFIFKPTFPQNELDVFNQNSFQKLKIEFEKVKFLAEKRIFSKIYGLEHPLGAEIEPNDVFNVTRTQMMEFHRLHYSTGNCCIVVAGDTSEDLLNMLNEALYPFCIDEISQIAKPEYSIKSSRDKFEYIQKPSATQAAIRMACLIDYDSFADYHMLKVLNTLLGGYFGSRLMKNIREDKGLTYGIGSSVQLSEGKALFSISAEVAGNMWQEALNEINFELKSLSEMPISDEELNLVKKTMLGDKLAMFDGAFASSAVFRSLLEAGLDYTFVEDSIHAIHQADENRLKTIASSMLQPEKMTVVVAGP